jgi:hypothetical protein
MINNWTHLSQSFIQLKLIFEISIPHNPFWTCMHIKFAYNIKLTKILTNMKLYYQLLSKHMFFLFSYWDSNLKHKISNIVKENVLKINSIWMILWKNEYKCVFIDFLSKILLPNKLFYYLRCILNSRILIQLLFQICIWHQNKSCPFWNVMKSYQFSPFVELCNLRFGILFEAIVLRIY